MKSRKNILRISAFLTILMFLIITLSSQPVSAAFTYYTEGATDNTPTGPTAVADCPPPYIFYDENPSIAMFELWYHFKDTNYEGSGSWHQARIRARLLPIGSGTVTANTGWRQLTAGGEEIDHISTTQISYTPTATFRVDIWIDCYDNDAGIASMVTASDTQDVTVY